MSSFEENTQRSIAISVGLNNSATLAAALARGDGDATSGTVLSDFASIAAVVVPLVLEHHGLKALSETEALDALTGQFGAVAVTNVAGTPNAFTPVAAYTNVAGYGNITPAQPANHTAQPSAIPGASDPDAMWRDFFNDQSGWFDNRFNKKNANGPDYKSKKFKQAGTNYPEGLWLTGMYPLTPWVRAELVSRGIIQ